MVNNYNYLSFFYCFYLLSMNMHIIFQTCLIFLSMGSKYIESTTSSNLVNLRQHSVTLGQNSRTNRLFILIYVVIMTLFLILCFFVNFN
jgi:hypothetical protein